MLWPLSEPPPGTCRPPKLPASTRWQLHSALPVWHNFVEFTSPHLALIICWLVIVVICLKALSSLPDCKPNYACPGSTVLWPVKKSLRHHAPVSELETQNRPLRTQLPTPGDGLHPWLNLQLFKTRSQFLIFIDMKSREYMILNFHAILCPEIWNHDALSSSAVETAPRLSCNRPRWKELVWASTSSFRITHCINWSETRVKAVGEAECPGVVLIFRGMCTVTLGKKSTNHLISFPLHHRKREFEVQLRRLLTL